MQPLQPVHVVAVFSQRPRVADFLKRALDSGGFATFAAPPGLTSLDEFVETIHPHAVVVDMTASGETQWQQLERLRSHAPFRDLPLVITTDDLAALQERVRRHPMTLAPVVQMFTRGGDDLRELRAAVHAAIYAGRPNESAPAAWGQRRVS